MYQVGSNDFDDSATIRENAENGRFETDYEVKAGPAFNISGGALLWRNLAIGVGVDPILEVHGDGVGCGGASPVLLQSAAFGDGRVRRRPQ